MNQVKTIKHISANLSLLRAQTINLIVRDEVSLGYVVPKTASFKKGNGSGTGWILTHADNPDKAKGNPPVDTETQEVAANLTAHTETHTTISTIKFSFPISFYPSAVFCVHKGVMPHQIGGS